MGQFLMAAERALREAKTPLTAAQITEVALREGYLATSGATPTQTMKARLSDDIRNNRTNSLFMRTEKGSFGLRSWKAHMEEYVADRFQKALLSENAVVFDASHLDQLIPNPGFHEVEAPLGADFLRLCQPMLRREAELNTSVIQLVSVFIVRWGKSYLTYKRSGRLPEKRLHGEYSVIFGGHLTPEDLFGQSEWPTDPGGTFWNIFDPDNGIYLLEREFEEELRVKPRPSFKYRGLLFDDSRDVSRQHLGIVYDAVLANPRFTIGERGFLVDAKFEDAGQIIARLNDFENWSHRVIAKEIQR